MMRRLALGGAFLVALGAAVPATASRWSQAGGDGSHSGAQHAAPGEVPLVAAWSRGDTGVRTPVVITGGGGPGIQRVAYGTTAGAVHLQVLDSGAAVGPEEGVRIVDTSLNPAEAFGRGVVSAAFADASSTGRLGILYVVHNEATGVDIARIDEATGARVDQTDWPVASSLGCMVNGSPVLTPPTPEGSRILYLTLKGTCTADQALVRIPIQGDAASPGATLGTPSLTRLAGLEDGVGPSLVVLPDNGGAPRFYVAVGRDNGVDFFDASKPLDPSAAPDRTVALPAGETAMTVSAPGTAAGVVAGGEGSGTPPAAAMYVAALASGSTKVYRLVPQGQQVVLDSRSTGLLQNSGAPAPALAVAQAMTPGGPTADGRLVVTSAQNLSVVSTDDMRVVKQFSDAPLPDGKGFGRTIAAVSGAYAFAMRDGSASVAGEHVALRLDSGARLPASDFSQASGNGAGASAGQPAIARGLVVFGSAAGAFAYRSRDVTAPAVSLLAPAAGAKATAAVPFTVQAADDRGIASVLVRLVSGATVRVVGRAGAAESGSPFDEGARYSGTADLAGVPPGEYDMEAVAADPTGNTAVSARRRLVVTAPGPPRPQGACLNPILGTARADRLVGTDAGDRIIGGRGNDRLSGRAGHDCLRGEAGNDRLDGGAGDDDLAGAAGTDRLAGGSGRDDLRGGLGRDTVSGGAGDDIADGGPGDDRLSGGAGLDRLSGGRGRDRISVRGGGRDAVRCGAGRDVVFADRADRVARDCERVIRR